MSLHDVLDAIPAADPARKLLIDVILRAAFDWVLYRDSKKLAQQQLAREAYIWLFDEGPGHPHWRERLDDEDDDSLPFAFISVCDAMNLNPGWIRSHIRRLTRKDITSSGRPRIYRRSRRDDL